MVTGGQPQQHSKTPSQKYPNNVASHPTVLSGPSAFRHGETQQDPLEIWLFHLEPASLQNHEPNEPLQITHSVTTKTNTEGGGGLALEWKMPWQGEDRTT